MSSCGNPATEVDAIMPRRRKFDRSKECVRCKSKTGNIVVRYAVYCKECFFPLIATKFRRSLEPIQDGPRRTSLKASGNLLVGFSGGLGSTVLLDLVSQCYFSARATTEDGKDRLKGGKDHPRNASVWPRAAVCYVEVCGAFQGMRDRTDEVRTAIGKYKAFNFIPLRVEDAFDNSWWEKVGGKPIQVDLDVDITNEDLFLSSVSDKLKHTSPISSLHSYMSSLPTQTAIPSAIQTLTRLLLLYTAQSTNSSHLLLGTSLTSLSISLISSISQGGGYVVREEVHEEWIPNITPKDDVANGREKANVRISRPLRDIGMKECAIWAWWKGLNVVGREKLPGTKQGIRPLTKDFIIGLERDYPSTVSTIARTCAKLAPKEGIGGICVLCERPAQYGVQDWKTRISIRSFIDQAIPGPYPPQPDDATSVPQTSSSSSPPSPSLTPYLCYACHTTLTSRSSRGTTDSKSAKRHPVLFPVWVRSQLNDSLTLTKGGSVSVGTEGLGDAEGEEVWERKMMGVEELEGAVAEFLLE